MKRIRNIFLFIGLVTFLVSLSTLAIYVYQNYQFIISPETSPNYSLSGNSAFGDGNDAEKFSSAWIVLLSGR